MIYTIGESLLDIIFRNGLTDWSCPGGSMLNAAVSVGRVGLPVEFITEAGNDKVGRLIRDFLDDNGVGVNYIHTYSGKSTLALAFLDNAGDASYQFYPQLPVEAPEFNLPSFKNGDVLIFGSFYSIDVRNLNNLGRITAEAARAGATLIYDPNFRQPHSESLPGVLDAIRKNMQCADVVRASDEDMKLIAGAENGKQAYDFVRNAGCDLLVYTRNREGADLFTPSFTKHYDVPVVEVVSTVGAGDNFNAGLASFVHASGIISSSERFWDEAIGRAIIFAAEVCGSRENFISRKQAPNATI